MVLVQGTGSSEGHSQVPAGLATQSWKESLGSLPLNEPFQDIHSQRLDVDDIGDVLVGHDCSGVGVHQHRGDALFTQGAARLGAGIVELGSLPNDDGPGADN